MRGRKQSQGTHSMLPAGSTNPERILVRSTNWIGDVVMTLPALEALRERFPESRILVLARSWVAPLVRAHPAVDGVLELTRGRGRAGHALEVLRVASRVRRMRFDMAVLFQNAFEAALIGWVARVPVRVGYDTDARRPLLTHPLSRKRAPTHRHQVEYYLDLVRALGWKGMAREPRLFTTPEDRDDASKILAAEGLSSSGMRIGVAPGAAYGPAKRWPPERFARVADQAAEIWQAPVLILGSKGDARACEAVAGRMKHPAVNLCGRTGLGQAVALIESCGLFLTNDSGLMHVASALNVPTVAIFGSTDPVATGPRSPWARVVRNPVECSPCFRTVCPTDFRCMLGITAERVWQEAKQLLSG